MIYETKEISSELLSGLKPNNYTRRIKSHFAAYGTGYDFLHFYAVEESGEKLGIISVFNASIKYYIKYPAEAISPDNKYSLIFSLLIKYPV